MEILNKLGALIAKIPKPIRDFTEGLVAVGIAGAGAGVLGLNLLDPTLTPQKVEFAAAAGAIAAVIAFCRRAITPPTTP